MQLIVPSVVSVSANPSYRFSKPQAPEIQIVEGRGVVGDAHFGEFVRHRSRVKKDPTQPNLRQVHLIAAELLDEMASHGFSIGPGQLGENILTAGVDLIELPSDTLLLVGRTVRLRVTGLRNPCHQIESFRPGLLKHMVGRNADGTPRLKTGIMTVVERGGYARPGDQIKVKWPAPPFKRLERV